MGPAEKLDWTFNWDDEDWLGSETISTSAWTVGPTGPTVSNQTNDATTATCRITGLTYGVQYVLKNDIVTSGGQFGTRSIVIRCTDSP